MRISRIYTSQNLNTGQSIILEPNAANHIVNVLRLKSGVTLTLFNGQGGEYTATLSISSKHKVSVEINEFVERDVRSPLKIHLAQGISKGDKMDFTIQKAVELGVSEITPLITMRVNMKFTPERLEKRLKHWQGKIISACEQCGLNTIPTINEPVKLDQWLGQEPTGLSLVLYHRAKNTLKDFPEQYNAINLLIGPEGGLSSEEIELAEDMNFQPIKMGPRIMRTETAGLAAIAILQNSFGDI